MMTMSQVVHGTAPAATGDGRESRDGRYTAPGAEQQELDQAPNTEGQQVLCLWRQEPFHPTMPQAGTSKVEFVGAMVEYDSEVEHQAF